MTRGDLVRVEHDVVPYEEDGFSPRWVVRRLRVYEQGFDRQPLLDHIFRHRDIADAAAATLDEAVQS